MPRFILFLALLFTACVQDSSLSYPLGPPPELDWPRTWRGVTDDDQREVIIIMTPAEHQKLREQIQRSRNWMRQANQLLIEAGVDTTKLSADPSDEAPLQ